MTVCIAAACKDKNGQSRIVICTDKRVGSALGSTDTGMKERNLHHGWKCLTSGGIDDINALMRSFISPNGDDFETSLLMDGQLAELYKKYGPKKVPDNLSLKSPFFYDHVKKEDREY